MTTDYGLLATWRKSNERKREKMAQARKEIKRIAVQIEGLPTHHFPIPPTILRMIRDLRSLPTSFDSFHCVGSGCRWPEHSLTLYYRSSATAADDACDVAQPPGCWSCCSKRCCWSRCWGASCVFRCCYCAGSSWWFAGCAGKSSQPGNESRSAQVTSSSSSKLTLKFSLNIFCLSLCASSISALFSSNITLSSESADKEKKRQNEENIRDRCGRHNSHWISLTKKVLNQKWKSFCLCFIRLM